MLVALVVIWLGSEAELVERRSAIATWASARAVRAEPTRPTGPRYDDALAEQIEALLEEARAATATQATPGALERAEALLREHPELPQAAWLLAERFAIEAHAPGGADAAASARRHQLGARARELEGARAEPAGALAVAGAESSSSPRATAPRAPRPHDRVFIDGALLGIDAGGAAHGDVAVDSAGRSAGEHHVLVTRAGLPVWSGWVTLEAGRSMQLTDPSPACSVLDLADVSVGGAAPEPAPGVLCERWGVARPSLRGGADIAECARSRCGAWQWASGAARPVETPRVAAPAAAAEPSAWPGWATWSLVGAGTLAATGLVLWRVGAFDRAEPGTEFVFTGPSAPAYRF